MKPLHILGIAGSIRSGSYNRYILEYLKSILPTDVTLEIIDIDNLPLFSQDSESPFPHTAQKLKESIKSADGIIFATPEYNRSIPGVLKNAIDWGSRPYGDSAWAGKPVGIIGATPAATGTVAAQQHLKQICAYLDMHIMGQPEVYISTAHEKFDTTGVLTDVPTQEHLQKFLDTFVPHIKQSYESPSL